MQYFIHAARANVRTASVVSENIAGGLLPNSYGCQVVCTEQQET